MKRRPPEGTCSWRSAFFPRKGGKRTSPKDSSVDLLPIVEGFYRLSTLESLAEIFELLS